jgi:hypothetical protein
MKSRIPYLRTTEQKRDCNREINYQLAEHMKTHEIDYIALSLFAAHCAFGFGKKRLLLYYNALLATSRELEQFYEMDDGAMYLAKTKLKELGIDLDEMHKENLILSYEVEKKV